MLNILSQQITTFLTEFFKYLPILISSYYIFNKSLNIKLTKLNLLLYSISTLVITISVALIAFFDQQLSKILLMLLYYFSILIINKKLFYTPATIISIGISYSLRLLGTLVIGILLWIFNISYSNLLLVCFLIMGFSIIAPVLFMRIKRFRNGFAFYQNKDNFGLGLVLSGFIVTVLLIVNSERVSDNLLTAFIIGVFISLVGLVIWIRKSISNRYTENLRKKELVKFENDIAQKDDTIRKLNNSNAYLSKIVHRDNHLIGSLQYSIKNALDNQQDLSEIKATLSDMLTMFEQRSELITKEQAELKILPSTGISMIDGALANMLVKANAHNISFDVSIHDDIYYLVNNIISLTQLETLLCDHIKDAVIAVESSKISNGRILVTFAKKNGIFEISVSDNGHEFDIDVLAKLGIERITTHKDSGGSGIGFMTSFETLNQTGCSLIINEFENKIPFSKSIIFRFDGQKNFIISTYRYNILSQHLNRNDIELIANTN